MNRHQLLQLSFALSTLLTAGTALAQHGHLNAGATGQSQNSQLVWDNGAAFAAGSGYVQTMALATNPASLYFGLFNSGPTLTALSMTNLGGPAAGSFLTAEIVSVAGPAGALFSFWEGEDQGGGSSPLFNIPTGGGVLSYQFDLSDATEGAGQSGQDPFGHLHGRRFTTSTEGLYTIGIRVLDTSVNGAGGGPIHLPSEVLYMNFATVPEPSVFGLAALGLAGAWWLRRRRQA